MKAPLRSKRKRVSRETYNRNLKKKLQKPIPRTVVPSFFTLMNLFSGFMAIVQIMEGNMVLGAWLIFLAGFFDLLDGFMARLANATGPFGIELDSLSDVVSFGVAPGMLLWKFGFNDVQTLGMLLSALPALFGAVRLARFNVEATEKDDDYFKGLPIPVQAAMYVGFYLSFHQNTEVFSVFENGLKSVLIPLVITTSVLMVTTVPFDKIPRIKKGEPMGKKKWTVLLFILYFIIFATFHEYGIMVVFTLFLGKGMIKAGVQFWNDLREEEQFET